MPRFQFNRWPSLLLTSLFALLFVSSASQAQTTEANNSQVTKDRITFTDVALKATIKTLTNHLKLNVVFDETFRDEPKYNLELNDVTVEAALKIIFVQKRLAAKLIEEKTIIVFSDNPTTRARFEEYPDWPAKSGQKK